MLYIVKGKLVQMEEDQEQVTAIHKNGDQLVLEQKVGGWQFRGEVGITPTATKGEAIKQANEAGYEVLLGGKKIF